MIYGLKFIARYLLGLDQAERNLAVYPDDTFLVSYPRSGNTWTRFLIANLLHPEQEVSFVNIERLIPDTSSQSNRTLKCIPRPRFIKTHAYFDHRYRRVIYIVRDPRDVVLSYYNFQRKYRQIEDNYSLERYVEDYVSGRLISFPWGTWGENVGSWISTRGQSSNFLLLRYEDMLADTKLELARVAQFLGLGVEPKLLTQAVERSSSDRMREMEKRETGKWVATKKHRKDIPFVGAAQAGNWKTLLSENSVRLIESSWGGLMASMGYGLAGDVPEGRQAVTAMERAL